METVYLENTCCLLGLSVKADSPGMESFVIKLFPPVWIV